MSPSLTPAQDAARRLIERQPEVSASADAYVVRACNAFMLELARMTDEGRSHQNQVNVTCRIVTGIIQSAAGTFAGGQNADMLDIQKKLLRVVEKLIDVMPEGGRYTDGEDIREAPGGRA